MTNIFSRLHVIIIMLIMMTASSVSVWADPTYQEVLLYKTDFQNWTNVKSSASEVEVNKDKEGNPFITPDNQEISFFFKDAVISNKGHYTNSDPTKQWNYNLLSDGWIQTDKNKDPHFRTSRFKSITKIIFNQAATGGKRGWHVKAIDENNNETIIREAAISQTKGEKITLDNLNLQNVQLYFSPQTLSQNSYMTDLEIWGLVEVKTEATVSYYDTDGTLLGEETFPINSKLEYNKTYESRINVPAGYKFRGWFSGTGASAEKVAEGTELTIDQKLYAKVTPIEEAVVGSEYTYDLAQSYWYEEDHELIDITGGSFHDNQHGWSFDKGAVIKLNVAESARIEVTTCQYSNSGNITATDNSGMELASFPANRDATQSFNYIGGSPTTITLSIPNGAYIHSIRVLNYIPVYVNFALKNDNIEGACPESIMSDPVTHQVKLPTNALFYRKGWTFTGWTDGTTTYEGGATYTFEQEVTLTPKMRENTKDITDTNSPISVEWPFDYRKAPAINMNSTNEPKRLPYTRTATVEGEQQDITMWMDTSKGGKITNTDERINGLNNGAEGGQLNNNTVLTIPAVYGMTITVNASDKIDDSGNNTQTNFGTGNDDAEITISDALGYFLKSANDGTVSNKNKTITFTYNGDATSVDINIDKSGCNGKTYGFFKNITVTYPVLPNVVAENTIEATDGINLPNEKNENAGTVVVSSNAEHSNTGKRFKKGDFVTISAKADYGYKVTGFRVKGSTDMLPTTSSTDDANGTVLSTTYTVTDGITTIEAIYDHLPLYKVTVKSSNTSYGNVTISPVYDNFYNEIREGGESNGKVTAIESWATEGTTFSASAVIEAECVVESWEEDGENKSDANDFTFTVGTSEKNVILHMKPGEIGTVIFDTSGERLNDETVAAYSYGAVSMAIPSIEKVKSFTVPTNYTIFKGVDENGTMTDNSYTLQYWIDPEDNNNRYDIGKTYSFKKKQLTLTPVFTYNPTTRTNRANEPVVRYDFGSKLYTYYDPTSKKERTTCAQAVNIGNNVNTFWTTQAYFEVNDNGVTTSHIRDVALWINTGKEGYIKNDDLGDWCAMGPGTTLWCTSSVGTKVSILTYSPITSTTIDGVVPTLDEERTATERENTGNERLYVYSHTTDNADTRLPIVIGDDYSYYQWIEVSMRAANLVNLHYQTDNAQHGKVTNIKSRIDETPTELEDGGYAFRQGDRVRMTFKRRFGYELDKINVLNQTDNDGNPVTVLKMNDDGTVSMVNASNSTTLITVPQNEDGTWGIATGDDKTVFTLKATEPTVQTADSLRTTYELEFEISTHRQLEICFKEKPTYYITYNPGEFASGTSPSPQWVEAGDEYTIPRNQTLYYEGNTLKYWVDSDYDENAPDAEIQKHTYRIGSKHIAPAEDVRMFPVFEVNTFNILDLTKESTTTWHLAQKDNAPIINHEKTNGLLVSQLYNDEEWIDLKLDLLGKNGKINNVNDSSRVQINDGSLIGFPSTPACVAKLTAKNSDVYKELIAGNKEGDPSFIAESNYIQATCSGDSAIQYVDFKRSTYCVDFMVTYKPQTVKKATIATLTCEGVTLDADEIKRQMESEDKCITFTVSPWKNANEAVPSVSGTATEGGKVTCTTATLSSREAVATVRNAANVIVETYPIRFKFNTPDDSPKFVKIAVNGKEYTTPNTEVFDVARNGMVKIVFNRTMAATSINYNQDKAFSAPVGKELDFKYWDLEEGSTITYTFTPDQGVFKDIYGKVCQETLSLTLHITNDAGQYNHEKFDFIVGEDGDINEAINAANANKKTDGKRYYVFIPDGEYELTGNDPLTDLTQGDYAGKDNNRTKIARSNVSLIGQSRDGVRIWNRPALGGIRYAATIHVDKNVNDLYFQDITLENRFDYWGSSGDTQAAAYWDQGSRNILKDVSLVSWQDTYYSNNANEDFRGYFETCDIYGVVDFLCGDGNIWFEKCNIILRDRNGNNIAAPSQGEIHKWGYVINDCHIKAEDGSTKVKDHDWTLARPWNGSPACTYLNTTMHTVPTLAGWNKMSQEALIIRFHEYGSKNANNVPIVLGARTIAACGPAPGSDDCVLNSSQADQYTLRNVMGGTDGFQPDLLCTQIDAASSDVKDRDGNNVIWNDNILVDDDVLQWDADQRALCYFLFKYEDGKWNYVTNTTETNISLNGYGSGRYCVRAANQRGGLGAATKVVDFTIQDPYELVIKQLGDLTVDGVPYGWSTICLPFNAKVPEEVTAYAATAYVSPASKSTAQTADQGDDSDADREALNDDKVKEFLMTLTPVTVINGTMGYVVYGPAGSHNFAPTSRTNDEQTILTGNSTRLAMSTVNNPGYVLANKNWGLGFYKYAGSTYAPFRAWLPQDMVESNVQTALASGTMGIRFSIVDKPTSIVTIRHDSMPDDVLYDLSGRRMRSAATQGVYITKKGKRVFK